MCTTTTDEGRCFRRKLIKEIQKDEKDISDSSTFTGVIDGKITNAGGTSVSAEVGAVNVTPEGGRTRTLTGDSCVTSFTGDASNVLSNGYTLYVNGVALTGTK